MQHFFFYSYHADLGTTILHISRSSINPLQTPTMASVLHQEDLKEYRLIINVPAEGTGNVARKIQGPRLCNRKGQKIFFTKKSRQLLGVWVHNANFLSANYSGEVEGFANNSGVFTRHIVTYKSVRSKMDAMLLKQQLQGGSRSSSNSNGVKQTKECNNTTTLPLEAALPNHPPEAALSNHSLEDEFLSSIVKALESD